jgi:type I restriction enzyme S subunit
MGAQRKIAAVLSAYDELIENNNRRIKLLEEMAQRVYREWFVDFRYPGNEGVPLVDSELGLIPEGWKVERIADRFEVVLGGTPSRKNLHYWLNGTVPWINSGQVNRLRVIGASEMITPEALKSSSTKLMPRGTTLLAITGATLGQVSLLEIEACANQSVVGIYDQLGELTEYLYLAIGNSIESIIGAASGGAQQHINQQNVKETLITVPSTEIGAEFQLRVRPLFSLLANLLKANQRLSDCRDLLLPRLVSGEIDVSKLDITMTEATA